MQFEFQFSTKSTVSGINHSQSHLPPIHRWVEINESSKHLWRDNNFYSELRGPSDRAKCRQFFRIFPYVLAILVMQGYLFLSKGALNLTEVTKLRFLHMEIIWELKSWWQQDRKFNSTAGLLQKFQDYITKAFPLNSIRPMSDASTLY